MWIDLYQSWCCKVGWDFYGLFGIECVDKECMYMQYVCNFCFFDVLVGIIFMIDCVMEQGSWFDYGMFLEVVMVVVCVCGIDMCLQVVFMQFYWIIVEYFVLIEDEMVVCGMLMGYVNFVVIENMFIIECVFVFDFICFFD